MATDNVFAFVLMPFNSAFDDVYKVGIKETAASLDILAERVDEQIFQEGMLERIYRQIDLADIIVADMSGQNPNVFYEVGYAHAQEKICILLTSDAADIPFDLKHHRHIVYGNSITALRAALEKDLAWAKTEIENTRASHIKVKVKSLYGDLETKTSYAKGTVDFKIDLLNESTKPTAEIEAIYFYSTKDWIFSQDGRECSSTSSDIYEFSKRHFINPPIRRLRKDSWAQLNFSGKKYLAWAHKGEEVRDSYKVSGRSILRIVTSEGNFDHELSLEVVCDQLPF